MDQTLPLPSPAVSSHPAPADFVGGAPQNGLPADEEPDSPGRSPSRSAPDPASSAPDPLADGLALLVGCAIALIAVLVPVLTVIAESPSAETLRQSTQRR